MFNKLLLLVWRVSSSLVRPILMIHVKKLLVWRVCCKTMSLSLHINHSRSDINLSSSSMSSYFDFVSFVFLCPTCCSKPEEYSEEYKSQFLFSFMSLVLYSSYAHMIQTLKKLISGHRYSDKWTEKHWKGGCNL